MSLLRKRPRYAHTTPASRIQRSYPSILQSNHRLGCEAPMPMRDRMQDGDVDARQSAGWRRSARLRYACGSVATLFMLHAGCAVGPRFVRPAAPTVTAYSAAAAAPTFATGVGEQSQHLAIGQEIPAAWWQRFHSPALDNVVRQALVGSPTLDAAKATLAQAQQAVTEARGAYYPQVDFAASAERQKGSGVCPRALALTTKPSCVQPVLARADRELLAGCLWAHRTTRGGAASAR